MWIVTLLTYIFESILIKELFTNCYQIRGICVGVGNKIWDATQLNLQEFDTCFIVLRESG